MSESTQSARLDRILLATDGSKFSAGAMRVAVEAARKCGSHLTVLTMVVSNPEVEAIAPQVVAKAELYARRILDDVERQATVSGVVIERLVRHGQDPAHQIIRQAEKKAADLIVMGRRDEHGLARMLVAEATVKVCGKAPCSVLVVPRAGELPCQRILIATDGSRHAVYAAIMAARLAGLCNLPVTVLSVILPRHNEARRAEAAAEVARVKQDLLRAGLDAETVVINAPKPEIGIIETANARGVDLIVLGSHGRTGLLEEMVIGSVSERVLGSATCPVLVAKLG